MMLELLARHIRAAGLGIGPLAKAQTTHRMMLRGQAEWESLRRECGPCLDPYANSSRKSLASGCALTSYAISGIHLDPQDQKDVTALGGLATLIVSAFDALLDTSAFIENGTLPNTLIFGGETELRSRHTIDSETQSAQDVVESLICLYYRRLNEIPHRNSSVRVILEKAIRRMYQAERGSVVNAEIGRRVWWGKDVLPFVVMGLPAWLAARSFDPQHLHRHLRWLCRLGEFLGWVDDWVDFDTDISTGQANRLIFRFRGNPPEIVARQIARQGRRVRMQWNCANHNTELRSILAVMVWAWIDSPNSRASAS